MRVAAALALLAAIPKQQQLSHERQELTALQYTTATWLGSCACVVANACVTPRGIAVAQPFERMGAPFYVATNLFGTSRDTLAVYAERSIPLPSLFALTRMFASWDDNGLATDTTIVLSTTSSYIFNAGMAAQSNAQLHDALRQLVAGPPAQIGCYRRILWVRDGTSCAKLLESAQQPALLALMRYQMLASLNIAALPRVRYAHIDQAFVDSLTNALMHNSANAVPLVAHLASARRIFATVQLGGLEFLIDPRADVKYLSILV